jgi:hypothetical protein
VSHQSPATTSISKGWQPKKAENSIWLRLCLAHTQPACSFSTRHSAMTPSCSIETSYFVTWHVSSFYSLFRIKNRQILRCTYANLNTYLHIYTDANINSHLRTYTDANINSHLHTYINANINSQLHTYINANINSHLHTYINANINSYLHTYIHKCKYKLTFAYIHKREYKHICIHT